MRDYTGHAIVAGELKFVSVSQVKMFDLRTKGGCPRRWAFEKVFGLKADKDKNKEAKDKGTALDKELKHYLLTGEKALSSLALRGLHILPEPGPGLSVDIAINTVEHCLNGAQIPSLPEGEHDKYPAGTQHVVRSALTAAGVPFVGELDLAQSRGVWRDEEGQYHDDPPGTIEVGDIKFKGNTKDRNGNSVLMLPGDLVRDIQMAGYGEWVSRVRPNVSNVRVSLLVFPDKDGSKTGVARKITRLHVLEDYHRTWSRVETVVREMKDVARVKDVEQVPGANDLSTCDSYSGCPHREYCTAYKRNSLDKVYGKLADDYAQEKNMGLMANNPQIMNQAPAQQPVAAQQAPQDMRQQLAAEEAQMRATQAQQQAQMPQQINYAELAQVCSNLKSYGFGFPMLLGNAAQAFAVINNQQIAPGSVYAGVPAPAGARRSLHGVQLTEVAHIYTLEGELRAAQQVPVAQTPPAPIAQAPQQYALENQQWQLPPNVQQQIPTVPNGPQPGYNAVAQIPPAQPQAGGFLPPDAPQSMPQLAMQQSAPPQQTPAGATNEAPQGGGAPTTTQSEPTKTKKKGGPGRPKNQDAPAGAPGPLPGAQIAASAQGTSPIASSAPASPVTAGGPSASAPTFTEHLGPRVVLVNCRTEAFETSSLASYVDYINKEVAKRYNIGKDGRPGILDVRAASDGSVLGYGGWKGVVREITQVDQPGDGLYHLDTHRDDLSEAVADGLRQAGWVIIRGVFA